MLHLSHVASGNSIRASISQQMPRYRRVSVRFKKGLLLYILSAGQIGFTGDAACEESFASTVVEIGVHFMMPWLSDLLPPYLLILLLWLNTLVTCRHSVKRVM